MRCLTDGTLCPHLHYGRPTFPQYRRGSVPDWNIRKVMEHVIGIAGRSQKLLCSRTMIGFTGTDCGSENIFRFSALPNFIRNGPRNWLCFYQHSSESEVRSFTAFGGFTVSGITMYLRNGCLYKHLMCIVGMEPSKTEFVTLCGGVTQYLADEIINYLKIRNSSRHYV